MTKLVSLRTQQVIMFIPFVNCFLLFVWLYNYSRTSKELEVLLKSILAMCAISIPFVILSILLSKIFPLSVIAHIIESFVMLYIVPFVVGFILIKYQKKTLSDYFQSNIKVL